MSANLMNYMPKNKRIESETKHYRIRYHQERNVQSNTDGIFIWSNNNKLLIFIYDMNNFPQQLSLELVSGFSDVIKTRFVAGGDVLDCFYAGREFVGDWVENAHVSLEQRFINPGLIMIDGETLSYTGAYFPIYLCGDRHIELVPFNGTVWGIKGLSNYPAVSETMKIEKCAYILSSGMLESRNQNGEINGDSILRKVYENHHRMAASELFETIKMKYSEQDYERLNSHSVLLIERIGG